MNITLKATLALGVAGLSLLALAGGASAQTNVGDPNLTTDFSTFKSVGGVNVTVAAVGLGFDASGGGGKLPVSPDQATAQSVYEAFTFDSSAAGAFSTILGGTVAQVSAVVANQNINIGSNFDVYASLYAYNPSAVAGTVPVLGPNLFGTEQKITLAPGVDNYFSADFTTTGDIVAGQKYVIGFTTLNTDTQDFAQIGTSSFNNSGLSGSNITGDFAADKTKFITDDNDQGAPTVTPNALASNNVLAFSLSAAPSAAPVPEGSMTLDFALGLGVLGAAVGVTKRRRSIAK